MLALLVVDASSYPTNPSQLVMEPRSKFDVVRCDEVFEVEMRQDRHNLNNSSEVLETGKRQACYIDPSSEFSDSKVLYEEENFEDYNDTDLSVKSLTSLEKSVGEYPVDRSVGFENVSGPDHTGDSTEYSESLKTILDDLDSCLDRSFIEDSSLQSPSILSSNSAGVVEKYDSDDERNGFVGGNVESTPKRSPYFSQAIDSVLVTKKRFVSTSRLGNAETPSRTSCERKEPPPNPAISQTDNPAPVPPYLPQTTRHPQVTYLSSLNSTGHLSPFMRSIANKYKLFDPEKPAFKDTDVGNLSDDSGEETYSTFLMGHTLDACIPDEEKEFSITVLEENAIDVNDMVRNYVYDVLAGADSEYKRLSADLDGLGKSDIDLAHQHSKPEDDESLMVCVDEYSTRFMDDSSRDNLSVEPDYRTEEEEEDDDSLSSDGGVLLCMTEGNDSSPPLSCCSASLYPCYVSTAGRQGEGVSDSCLDETIPPQKYGKSLPKPVEVEEGSVKEPPCISKYRTFSVLSDSKQVDCRPTRQTSSYCRIPFKDDVPTFWFKKDLEASPQPKKFICPLTKARSPKRPISLISGDFPSLFSLAEKVYLDEFKHKIELFKSENMAALEESKSLFFFSDRSPARKKRRKSAGSSSCENDSPRLALNFNSNALTKSGDSCTQETHIDPELLSSIDTYFAEKMDAPELAHSLPSYGKQEMKSVSCSRLPDWSEMFFDKRSMRSQSFHARNVKNVLAKGAHVQKLSHQSVPAKLCPSKSASSQGSQNDVNLMNECAEKRRKVRFSPRLKNNLFDDTVQLLSYKKLGDDNNGVHRVRGSEKGLKKMRSTSRDVSVVDLILQHGAAAHARDKKTESLPRHKMQEIMQQIADQGSVNGMFYFDHGDEPEVKFKQTGDQENCEINIARCEDIGIGKPLVTVQEAVDEHVETASQKPQGLTQVIRMLDTRQKLYEAISEAVTFCADEIGKEVEDGCTEQGDNEVYDLASQEDDTPDPETLSRDLKSVDLSGTPVYATAEGTDTDMKVFLSEAMESFDNILIESFASSPDSFMEESPCTNESLTRRDLNSIGDPLAKEDEDGETLEIENDSILAVVGHPCILHEQRETIENSSEDMVLFDDSCDTTVEVADDSVLNVVGKKCKLYTLDAEKEACSDGQIPTLKEICCKVLKQLRKETKTTLRFRENVFYCDYDEVFELEEEGKQRSPTSHMLYSRGRYIGLPLVRTVKTKEGKLKAFVLDESNVPRHYALRRGKDIACYIGNPHFTSSPVQKDPSEETESYNPEYTEDSLVEEDEQVFPEEAAAWQTDRSIHNNSPVDPETVGKIDPLEALKQDSCRTVPVLDDSLSSVQLRFADDEMNVSEDASWVEEMERVSSAITPDSQVRDSSRQSLVMSDCPAIFDDKISSYPSPSK